MSMNRHLGMIMGHSHLEAKHHANDRHDNTKNKKLSRNALQLISSKK
jgi:hypothetical protein